MTEPEIKQIPIKDLMPPKYPGMPWPFEKSHELWERSQQLGHRQIALKRLHCSLEFVILTFQKTVDILCTMGLTTGQIQNLALKTTCPECGTKGKSFVMGTRQQDGAICSFVAEFKELLI